VVETNIKFRFPDLQLRSIRESERSAHHAYSSSNGASTCIVMVLGSAKKQEARRDTCVSVQFSLESVVGRKNSPIVATPDRAAAAIHTLRKEAAKAVLRALTPAPMI